MKRLYIVPSIVPTQRGNLYPKYMDGGETSGWAGIRWFGTDPPSYLVLADVSEAFHDQIGLKTDVIILPQLNNIDNQVGANLTQVQNKLQALNLPSEWVTATFTYRQILRLITAAMMLSQRTRYLLKGQVDGSKLFPPGVSLSTRVNQLSPTRRAALIQAGQDLGVDTSGLSGASTMREVIRTVAQQKPGAFELGLQQI